MHPVLRALKNLIHDESGQDLIEYALIATLIGLVAVTSLGTLASKIVKEFGVITAGVQ